MRPDTRSKFTPSTRFVRSPSLLPAVVTMALNAVVCLYAANHPSTATVGVLNIVAPIVLVVVCGVQSLQIVFRDSLLIWAPVTWFLAASAVYFGLGPLAYIVGGPETLAYLDSFYPVDPIALIKTNALNCIGIGLILTAIEVYNRLRPLRIQNTDDSMQGRYLKRAAIFFVGVGVALKYLIILPYSFGVVSFVLPGFIVVTGNFTTVGIILIWFVALRFDRRWLPGACVFSAVEAAVALITFSKLSCITVIFGMTIGAFMAVRRVSILVAGAALSLTLYGVLLEPIAGARLFATDRGAAVAGRYDSLREGYVSAKAPTSVQSFWTRICFSNAQAFAMAEYEKGRPGATLAYLPYIFVPRFIMPNKPIMNFGPTFNEAVTGHSGASTPGIFGEAYWNHGWLGVIAWCIYIGVLFAAFSEISVKKIGAHDVRWLPCAFAAIFMGCTPADCWLLSSYMGSVAITAGLWVCITACLKPPRGGVLKTN